MLVYQIFRPEDWASFVADGAFAGSPDDLRDGFIHLSAGDQVSGSIARHFAGTGSVVLAAFDAADLGDDLRWEISRGGASFPHLYAALSADHVKADRRLILSGGTADDQPIADALAFMAKTAG